MHLQGFETVTPRGWGLLPASAEHDAPVRDALGFGAEELLEWCRQVGYGFVLGLYDPEVGALHHWYEAGTGQFGPFDSGNFLMALNFVVMFDLFGDTQMLDRAERCLAWAIDATCVTHPMFFWRGGVRDGDRPQDVWVKYTGDALRLAAALARRRPSPQVRGAVSMFESFLRRARDAGFRYTFDMGLYAWRDRGNVWASFGVPITTALCRYEQTGNLRYRDTALAWGLHGLRLQAPDGLFYLVDGELWNSDLTATELRGLVFLYEVTGDATILRAARRFADALLTLMRSDGSWPLSVDRHGEVAIDLVGPGDASNIALSLCRLHSVTQDNRYLRAAVRAVRYGLSMQAVETGTYPLHLDDPHVRWGFWSWDPLYDRTLSGDQSIHHVRGALFLAAYIAALARARQLPPSLLDG